MSKEKPTPGPWEVIKCACDHDECEIYQTSNGHFNMGSGYSKADAELIASAPDLLKELNELKSRLAAQSDESQDGLWDEVGGILVRENGLKFEQIKQLASERDALKAENEKLIAGFKIVDELILAIYSFDAAGESTKPIFAKKIDELSDQYAAFNKNILLSKQEKQ